MKLFFSSRLLCSVVVAMFLFVLSARSSAEVLKIVVDDTIHPIT